MYIERSVILGMLALGIIALVWRSSMSALERARAAGHRACKRADVQFLDESMVRKRLRLRLRRGSPPELERQYLFEFATRGDHRYRGTVTVSGRQPARVAMEAFAPVDQSGGENAVGQSASTERIGERHENGN